MKHIFWVLLVVAGMHHAAAQDVYTSSGRPGYHKKPAQKKGYDPSKLILGSGLDLQFGGGAVIAGLSPIVGYSLSKWFSAGVGLGYLYFRYPDAYYSDQYSTYYDKGHLIYPNVWARCLLYNNIYLTGTYEFDIIAGKYPTYDVFTNKINTVSKTVSAQCLLLGIGIRQPIGGRVSLFGQIQHEFLQQQFSPYDGQPIIFKAGICAGF